MSERPLTVKRPTAATPRDAIAMTKTMNSDTRGFHREPVSTSDIVWSCYVGKLGSILCYSSGTVAAAVRGAIRLLNTRAAVVGGDASIGR